MRRRRKISSPDLRYVIAFAVIATIATSGVAYTILYPAPPERFFAMYVLGSTGMAEHYYPNDNPSIGVGQEVHWTLGVYNHMGELEYVVVRVKLINSTTASPNDLTGTPSPAAAIFEFRRVLVGNETWSIPFTWQMTNLTQKANDVQITGLLLNDNPLSGRLASAESGYNFRFVFELWFYDERIADLTFSWQTNMGPRSVWNQLWFNGTITGQ